MLFRTPTIIGFTACFVEPKDDTTGNEILGKWSPSLPAVKKEQGSYGVITTSTTATAFPTL